MGVCVVNDRYNGLMDPDDGFMRKHGFDRLASARLTVFVIHQTMIWGGEHWRVMAKHGTMWTTVFGGKNHVDFPDPESAREAVDGWLRREKIKAKVVEGSPV